MQQRTEASDSLDFFPTPPWATRALLEYVIPEAAGVCWEPACGKGDMAKPLRDRFGKVIASDIHDYGYGEVRDFLAGSDSLFRQRDPDVDWIITNPPFNKAELFVQRCLEVARVGFAVLVRQAFLETPGRYQRLYSVNKPTLVAQFTERVVIHQGQLSAKGSTASSYVWVVWYRDPPELPQGHGQIVWPPIGYPGPLISAPIVWIPPCRKRLERPEDYR